MALTKVEAEQLQPAQTSITSVGTLTGLNTTGDIIVTKSSARIRAIESGGATTQIAAGTATGYVGTYSNDPLQILSNSTAAITIDTSQSATFAGNIIGTDIKAAGSGGLTLQTDEGTKRLEILDNGNITVNHSSFSSLPTGSKLNIFGDGITLRLDGTSGTTKSILFRGTNVANPGEVYADGSLRFRTEDASTRITFHTNSSGSNNERMRIESNGNVGIGVVPETHFSGVDALQVGLGASLVGNTTNPSRTYLNANAYINSSNQESYVATDEASQYFQNAGTHIFKVASSGSAGSAISWTTAMTIDNSGNILLGTDNTGPTNEGAVYFNGNSLRITRDSNEPLNLNRLTNQGNLVEFRQAGTTRGLIGTVANDLFICSGGNNSGHNGLRFHANGILPTDDTGAIVNNDADLGDPSYRFKDIYIAGGIDFGAATTTAENTVSSSSNLLDEYEEGQWTPTLTTPYGSIGLNSNMDTLSYTKIGRQVTVNGRIRFANISNASGYFRVSLPFAVMSNISGTQCEYAYFSLAGHNVNVDADIYGVFAEAAPGNNYANLLQKYDNAAWNYWDASNFSNSDYLYFAGTYFTNS